VSGETAALMLQRSRRNGRKQAVPCTC